MRLDIALEPSYDPNLHPSTFLVPEGYVGWLLLDYYVKDAEPSPIQGTNQVFKFPGTGALTTSSPGPPKEERMTSTSIIPPTVLFAKYRETIAVARR
jgi:hypothetical protein